MIIMNRTRCNLLILAAWVGGAVHAFSQFSMIISLPFCGPKETDYYYCDIFLLLQVAWTDTYVTGVLVVANSGMVALVTSVLLFGSYVIILFTLRSHSAEGRYKALFTCGSHITVVVLYFGPSIFAYLRPPPTFPEDKIFSLFYTIIVPMLNPLIYTLRNTEMKKAIRKDCCQKIFSEEKHNWFLLLNQSWVFIGRTDGEAETPILWPRDVKSWLIWKDPDAGKDWGQKEKGKTEDEKVGWHHRLNGPGFGWTLGIGDGQGSLVCCGSWDRKELDITEWLNWIEL